MPKSHTTHSDATTATTHTHTDTATSAHSHGPTSTSTDTHATHTTHAAGTTVATSTTPSSTPAPSGSSSPVSLAVGLSVGIPLLLLAAGLAFFFHRRHQKRRRLDAAAKLLPTSIGPSPVLGAVIAAKPGTSTARPGARSGEAEAAQSSGGLAPRPVSPSSPPSQLRPSSLPSQLRPPHPPRPPILAAFELGISSPPPPHAPGPRASVVPPAAARRAQRATYTAYSPYVDRAAAAAAAPGSGVAASPAGEPEGGLRAADGQPEAPECVSDVAAGTPPPRPPKIPHSPDVRPYVSNRDEPEIQLGGQRLSTGPSPLSSRAESPERGPRGLEPAGLRPFSFEQSDQSRGLAGQEQEQRSLRIFLTPASPLELDANEVEGRA